MNKRLVLRVPDGIRQSFLFGGIGLANTSLDVGIFLLLLRVAHMPVLLAQPVSYAVGICNSYFWNRRWTFAQSTTSRAFRKFLVVNVMSLGLSEACLYALQHTDWPVLEQKAMVLLVTFGVNFALSKWWVFREPVESEVRL